MFEQQWDFESGVAKTLSLTTQRRYQRLWGKKNIYLKCRKTYLQGGWEKSTFMRNITHSSLNNEDTARWKTSLKTCLHCISR